MQDLFRITVSKNKAFCFIKAVKFFDFNIRSEGSPGMTRRQHSFEIITNCFKINSSHEMIHLLELATEDLLSDSQAVPCYGLCSLRFCSFTLASLQTIKQPKVYEPFVSCQSCGNEEMFCFQKTRTNP